MKVYVVTYATHSEGNYENLINNNYGINVITLGWNTKWQGFDYKFKLLYDFIKNLPDDDIIISLDGFDVWINGYLDTAVSHFKSMNVKVLYSKDIIRFSEYKTLSKLGQYISYKIFGNCKNNYIANTGLYMGYVKYIKIILSNLSNKKCKDDQTKLNKLCHIYDFIDIDSNNIIFENISNNLNNIKKSKAIFVQLPGKLTIKRYVIRGSKEYLQFFLKEYLLVITVIVILLLYNKKFKLIILLFVMLVIFLFYIDKSCIF